MISFETDALSSGMFRDRGMPFMTQLPDSKSSAIRPSAAVLVLGLALFGCSTGGDPSPPGPADTASGTSGTAPSVSGKKTAQPGRVIQTPGAGDYEDKPRGRGQG